MTTNADNQSSSDVVGILFKRDRLDACRARKTLFGGVRYQYASAPIDNSNPASETSLADALKKIIEDLGGSKQPLPIAAAIPTDECYFATRPIASAGATASPRVLLRESLAQQFGAFGSNGNRRRPLATRSPERRRNLRSAQRNESMAFAKLSRQQNIHCNASSLLRHV